MFDLRAYSQEHGYRLNRELTCTTFLIRRSLGCGVWFISVFVCANDMKEVSRVKTVGGLMYFVFVNLGNFHSHHHRRRRL